MDMDILNGGNDQVTVQPGSGNINQSSAVSLHSIIILNPINITNNPDRSFESAMKNLTIQSISCDEEIEKSDEDFSNGNELGEHVDPTEITANLKKGKRLKAPVIFRCEICLMEFENANMLKEHLDRHDFQYSCETCGGNFKLTLEFIDHVWDHSTDKLYKCPLCEFGVEKRTKMTLHLQTKHEQFKKYRCEICNKGINVYTHFLQHKFIHNNEKPYKCDKCDSSFSQSASLHAHNTRMHMDDPIACDVCQKICRNKVDLRSHKTCHDKKPVVCEECGKILSSKDKLRIHERMHTGEKPYPCRHCPKSFKTSSFRSDHERIHTGVKPHICSICKKGFTQRTSMKIHETTHKTDKPFQCNICAKQFKSKIIYNGHMKKCRVNSAVEPHVKEEVSYNDGIGQNVLQEDVNPEQYRTLTNQNANQQLPLYQTYQYSMNNYYNQFVYNSSTIPQEHYPNMVINSGPSSNYVQLGMWNDQNRTFQVGNSMQTHETNFQRGILPISPWIPISYGSTSQLPIQNTQPALPSEMDNLQQNQQENG